MEKSAVNEEVITRKKLEIKKKLQDKFDREDREEAEKVNKEKKWAKRLIEEETIKQPKPPKTLLENGKVPVEIDSRTIILVSKEKCVQLDNMKWIKKKDAEKVKGKWVKKKQ